MQDHAPVESFAAVKHTIDVELLRLFRSQHPEWTDKEVAEKASSAFAFIDPVPLGSASIAQVHTGLTHDGNVVAIKIQHTGMRKIAESDLQTLRWVDSIISWYDPGLGLSWLFPLFKFSLQQELDFREEAANSMEAAVNLKLSHRQPSVYIPRVHHELSTSRILTMEYIAGCKVMNPAIEKLVQQSSSLSAPRQSVSSSQPQIDEEAGRQLRLQRISLSDAANQMIAMFSQQVFIDGFAHCDPHSGNLMLRRRDWKDLTWFQRARVQAAPVLDYIQDSLSSVRRSLIPCLVPKSASIAVPSSESRPLLATAHIQHPDERWSSWPSEVVLIDHGLYRRLTDHFRISYCELWKALIALDDDMIHEASVKLGCGQYSHVFAPLLTYRFTGSKVCV